jgi:ABC-type transport system involved in multi-copper enzyme maturation permease subunit
MTATTPSVTRVDWSASTLLSLVRAEYRKAVSTSTWWALLVPAALLCWLVGLVTAKAGGLAFTVPVTQALSLASFGSKFAAIFGVVCASAEFRHRTITTSYLSAPGRPQLLVAKAALAGAVGVGYALICSLAGVLGVLMGGASLSDDGDVTLGVSAVSLVLFLLWAVLGVGLGALLANQLTAIIGLLVYLVLVEQLVGAFASLSDLGRVQDFLPGGAASASLTNLAATSGLGEALTAALPPWWVSLLIFFGYTLAVFAAGMLVSQARDIT